MYHHAMGYDGGHPEHESSASAGAFNDFYPAAPQHSYYNPYQQGTYALPSLPVQEIPVTELDSHNYSNWTDSQKEELINPTWLQRYDAEEAARLAPAVTPVASPESANNFTIPRDHRFSFNSLLINNNTGDTASPPEFDLGSPAPDNSFRSPSPNYSPNYSPPHAASPSLSPSASPSSTFARVPLQSISNARKERLGAK
ncbi:hypothetical protein P7C70_g4698, partial [Phenoliferia sp. Uapishka_3]